MSRDLVATRSRPSPDLAGSWSVSGLASACAHETARTGFRPSRDQIETFGSGFGATGSNGEGRH